jgi:hypothetical protein
MNYVSSGREDATEPPHGAAHMGADRRPTPGTWEDQVLIFRPVPGVAGAAAGGRRNATASEAVTGRATLPSYLSGQ